jgi:hypothetical protein
MQAVLTAIADLPAVVCTRSSSADERALGDLLGRLSRLLEHDDMRASAVWRELKPLLRAHCGEADVAELARLIEGFDFPSARAALQSLVQAHPELALR